MIKADLAIVLHVNDLPSLSVEKLEEYSQLFFKELNLLLDEGKITKISIYTSGPFLESACRKSPALINALKEHIKQDRVEWLGGGFHDPVFPILPVKHQVMQIEKMNELIEKELGVKPRGMWLPSFVL